MFVRINFVKLNENLNKNYHLSFFKSLYKIFSLNLSIFYTYAKYVIYLLFLIFFVLT